MRLPDDQGRGAPPGNGESGDPNTGIGPRVSAVFTAAERAADHIVAMARAEVEDIRRAAQAEASTMMAQQREAAEQEARSILAAANAEAEAIRSEALQSASEVEKTARTREHAIEERVRYMAERADWARHSLSEALSQVEEFVARPPSEWPQPPPASESVELPPAPEPEREPYVPPAARMAGEALDPEPEPEEEAETEEPEEPEEPEDEAEPEEPEDEAEPEEADEPDEEPQEPADEPQDKRSSATDPHRRFRRPRRH